MADNSSSNPAAVQAGAANTTLGGAIGSTTAAVVGLITAVYKLFNLPSKPTGAQAALVCGAFFVTAASVLALAWVMAADFRSRAITHSAALDAGATDVSATSTAGLGFQVKRKDDGEVFDVLGVQTVAGGRTQFLINHVHGDQRFAWLGEDEVDYAAPAK